MGTTPRNDAHDQPSTPAEKPAGAARDLPPRAAGAADAADVKGGGILRPMTVSVDGESTDDKHKGSIGMGGPIK